MTNLNRKNKKGFTLIETLVAISILLIAVVGPLTISASSLQSSLNVRNQITASYLAEEGIEYVRNIRDTESLKCIFESATFCPPPSTSTSFSSFLNDITPPTNSNVLPTVNGYLFDIDSKQAPYIEDNGNIFNSQAIITCPNLKCPALNYNSGSGTYSHDGLDPLSQFTRTIIIKPISNDTNNANGNYDEYQVTVSVTWPSPLPDNTVTLSDDITNWQ